MTTSEEERNTPWLLDKFERMGALRTHSHFVLKSGLHTVSYVDKDSFTFDPVLLDQMASFLVFENYQFWDGEVSLVVSPSAGAVLFGGFVARHLGCNFIFTEKDQQGNQFLRPSFQKKLDTGRNILIVEDVVSRGTTIKQIRELLGSRVEDVKYACIWDRTSVPVPVPWLRSVVRSPITAWEEEGCPLCREGRNFDLTLGHAREFLARYGQDPKNWPANNQKSY